MIWFFAILVVLALGGVALVASGFGAPTSRAYDDRPDVSLPADRAVSGADLRRIRFTTVLRGYRMSEVDALLSRMAAELEAARSETAQGEAARYETGHDAVPPADDDAVAPPDDGDRDAG